MRILLVQTNYQGFLTKFYRDNADWPNLNFQAISNLKNETLFGSANFYSKSLARLGHLAKEIVADDMNLQLKWAKENKFYVNPNFMERYSAKLPSIVKNKLGGDKTKLKILFQQILDFKPDVVYFHDVQSFPTTFLKLVKGNVGLVAGQIAYPISNEKTLQGYDLLISSFPHYVKKFRNMGIASERLNWCFEDSILTKIKPTQRVYDVVFVGGFSLYHSHGNRNLEKLSKEVKIDFWGYGLNQLLPNSSIRKNYHGELWGQEMFEVFAKSKIVINRHINVAGSYANNMRMFDVTGMGALLITDFKPNMKEFFTDKEVVTYKNSNELIKKTQYFLNHPLEREKIAIAGQRRTLKEHTYTHRMKELAEIFKKYL